MNGLKLRPANECRWDIAALGECMVRLAPPGHGRIEFARTLEVDVGGGEYNVAHAAARLGLRSSYATRLPENPLSRIILNHARAAGVGVDRTVMESHDGIGRRNRVGLNFTEVGTGVRPSVTLYDRGHSSASQMQSGDVDWKDWFGREGVRWFHTGGIFTALSATCANTVRTALSEARAAGTITSYDLNFRSKLWTSADAIRITRDILPQIDVLIGNEEDFEKVLGMKTAGTSDGFRDLPVEAYKAMVSDLVRQHPHLKAVGTTLREVKSGLVNHWGGILWVGGAFYQARGFRDLEIEDRVGGGDGFSAGLAFGACDGRDAQSTVDFAVAHGALLQTTRGDTSQVTLAEVEHVARGGSARIQR